ncbi:hypothetical protein Tco_1570295, partial [Tanacetum coccineum]
LLDSRIIDKCKTGLGYNVIPPPYTGNFMPPKPDLVYPSLDDFVDVNESVSEFVVKEPTVESNEPKTARKENGAPIIKDWVSESEEEDEPKHMTGNRTYLTDYEEIDGGFIAFGGNSKGGKITGKGFCKGIDLSPKDSPDAGFKPSGEEEKKDAEDPGNEGGNPSEEGERINQEKDASVNNTNNINTVSLTVNAASIEDNAVDENIVYRCADDPNILDLEEIDRFSDAKNDDSGAGINNLNTYLPNSIMFPN